MRRPALFATGLLAAFISSAAAAQNVTIDIAQIGSDVVITTNGSILTTGLTYLGAGSYSNPQLQSYSARLFLGPGGTGDFYIGITGPTALGSDMSLYDATSATGDRFALLRTSEGIFLPEGYSSGASLSASTTFAGQTISSLGLTSGNYVFTGGGNTITVNIESTVPEPAAWAMMLGGFMASGAALRRRRKAVAAA